MTVPFQFGRVLWPSVAKKVVQTKLRPLFCQTVLTLVVIELDPSPNDLELVRQNERW
jgi:hypothetical protein